MRRGGTTQERDGRGAGRRGGQKRVLALAALAFLAGTLSACSGSSATSVSAYRRAALGVCEPELAFDKKLPQLVLREHLSGKQLQALDKSHNARFLTRFESLHPPASLKAAQTRLLHDIEHPAYPTNITRSEAKGVFVAYLTRVEADYNALGLGACANYYRDDLNEILHGN